MFNSGFNFRLNWNGKFENLAAQVDGALQNLQEMGNKWEEVVNKLRQSPKYVQAFAQSYPDGLTQTNIKDAIATYEQSLYTPNSRFDQFLRGNKQALTAAEQEGYRIFKAYGCVSCHQRVNVGGNMFARFGVIGGLYCQPGQYYQSRLGTLQRHQRRGGSLRISGCQSAECCPDPALLPRWICPNPRASDRYHGEISTRSPAFKGAN